MKNKIKVTEKEHKSWIQFLSYVRGWRDGASGRAKHFNYSKNGVEEIKLNYNEGYELGHKESVKVAREASKKFDYVPMILRDLQNGEVSEELLKP